MALEIPLTSDGSQKLRIIVNGTSYTLLISYNSRMNIWTCDISSNSVLLVSGVALLGGVDIVNQYPLNIKNLFTVNIEQPKKDANSENLGTDVKLVILSDEEIEQIG